MSKPKDSHTPITSAPKAAPVPVVVVQSPSTVCVICGQRGELVGDAGLARWHQECGDKRPDLVAKAKARA